MAEDHFPAILGLIGTISGTALGFAGGFIGQWFLEGKRQTFEKEKQEYERQKELKRRKAEKLEELNALLFEHMLSVGDRSRSDMIRLHARIRAIIHVYFSDLKFPESDLLLSASAFIGSEQDKENYLGLLGALLQEITAYAKREFQ